MNVALIGNPNCGKTSIFNQLTGLNQKVGNFSGVTVDKKSGQCVLPSGSKANIIDLPGTYSIYPKSYDEQVVINLLLKPDDIDYPDIILVVVDASNLRRNLLLFSQLSDLGIPCVLILNMIDIAHREGLDIDISKLESALNTKVIVANARSGKGIKSIKETLDDISNIPAPSPSQIIEPDQAPLIKAIKDNLAITNDYMALLTAHHFERLNNLNEEDKDFIQKLTLQNDFKSLKLQSKETLARHQSIGHLIEGAVTKRFVQNSVTETTKKIDHWLLHPIVGYLSFLGVLFMMFQLLFTVADYPIGWIEQVFEWINVGLKTVLPESMLTDLLTDGIVAGIGGVVVFVPQIAILFGMIALLEETGYITRVMVLMDKIMQRFGLNGQSIVPMISGFACAIPGIMSTRSIENRKERLITILITPLMSCSARLPIYTVIIGLVVPDERVWGIFHLKAVAMMGTYMLGIVMSLIVALVLKNVLKSRQKSFFIIELPTYKKPRWKNVGIVIYEKSKTFVWEAGKIITIISIILWFLAYFSPDGSRESITQQAQKDNTHLKGKALESAIASAQLEHSYAGHIGHFIEPVIRPLGYDWKIGIALITSFAAREVFVGTMATIYSIGSEEESSVIKNMKKQIRPSTGKPLYDIALGASLIMFYAFAMQCMGTVAVVYKETKSIALTLAQLAYMTGLAYTMALITYQLLK